MKPPVKNPTKQEEERARADRLRAALRENLRRRKAQARGRSDTGAATGQDVPEGPGAGQAKDGEG